MKSLYHINKIPFLFLPFTCLNDKKTCLIYSYFWLSIRLWISSYYTAPFPLLLHNLIQTAIFLPILSIILLPFLSKQKYDTLSDFSPPSHKNTCENIKQNKQSLHTWQDQLCAFPCMTLKNGLHCRRASMPGMLIGLSSTFIIQGKYLQMASWHINFIVE